jgi:tripartite-type tricarboxylate transporter receptor subunit TctC
MEIRMRSPVIVCSVAVFALSAAGIMPASIAQTFPAKPVRMIVPFAPGGPNDTLARFVAQKLTDTWGQTVVIENRGGAGGTVGMEVAARQPADGYTLAMGGSSNLAVAPGLYEKLPYDPVKDFTPIINVAAGAYALAVNPSVPAKNVKELVTVARTKAGYLSYGSSGAGSMSSLAAELFKSMSKSDVVHVPYKGTAPALMDVVTGQIEIMFADLGLAQTHAATGRLRLLGVSTPKRSAAAPSIPPIGEALPGYDVSPWFGLVAPAGVPKDIVTKLNAAAAAALRSADSAHRLKVLAFDAIADTPEHFAATMRSDIAKYSRIIRSAGIRVEQ